MYIIIDLVYVHNVLVYVHNVLVYVHNVLVYVHYVLPCCYYYCLISADVCAVLLINPMIAVTTNAIVKVGNVAPIVLSLCNI